mgnify:CR=1 FL=1
MTRLNSLVAALLLAPTLALAQMASAPFDGRLKKIHETKTISIAYRTDAMPFSFEEANKQPNGYMVDLCRRVIGVINLQHRRPHAHTGDEMEMLTTVGELIGCRVTMSRLELGLEQINYAELALRTLPAEQAP